MGKKRRSTRKPGKQPPPQPKIPLWGWAALTGVLAVLIVGGLFYLGNQDPTTASNNIAGVEFFPEPGAGHQEGDIAYADDAPVGGIHNPAWQNCGIYDEPVRVENVIHSLEHGAVWIAYRNLPADQVEILRELVREQRRTRREPLIILAPKPDLKDPIVATAWRVQLRLDNATDERLARFVSRYQRGPFTPEPGANCTGGIGEPLS